MKQTQNSTPLVRFSAAKNSAVIIGQNDLKKISGGATASVSIIIQDDALFIIEETTGI